MKKVVLIAASLAPFIVPALAGDDITRHAPAFECQSALNDGVTARKIVLDQQAWFKQVADDIHAGKRHKSPALDAEVFKHSDVALANAESTLISERFLLNQNCLPDKSTAAALEARIAEDQAALDDLKDERKQNDAARAASELRKSPQIVDTPEEAKARADLIDAPQNEQIVVAAATAYTVRDASDLCGFKLTAVAEHMIAGAEKFTTVEQGNLAETVSNKTRPRAPLAEFCNTVKEEFGHAPVKWFAE
jgi:hypothetical protein